jgi:glycosyltransferase involved in cell wall biosynthesis
MKVLVLYDYPSGPGGVSTQGALLHRGLSEIGVEVFGVNVDSPLEKEWYYRWFKPDVTIGIGCWRYIPQIVIHPNQHGMKAIPWLNADGYVANHRELLNDLPLILVTSNWVKEVYIRDGINGKNIEILPVGCDTEAFIPIQRNDAKVRTIRESLGIRPNECMILTVGGDAASKGAQEVLHALAMIEKQACEYKYVCKVWPQPRTMRQNHNDYALARQLHIEKQLIYSTGIVSRNFMPYLINACDIYAAPSRLEGFGMIQVEACACEKPIIGIKAMGMLDTMEHEKTALLADVAQEVTLKETMIKQKNSLNPYGKVVLDPPRVVDYRASIGDIANFFVRLMNDKELCDRLGKAGRKRIVEQFNYKIVARKFVDIIHRRFGVE